MFAWINRCCKQATSCTTVPFGGMSIILVGDIAQLPPLADQVCITQNPKVTGQLKETACIENWRKLLGLKSIKELEVPMLNNNN